MKKKNNISYTDIRLGYTMYCVRITINNVRAPGPAGAKLRFFLKLKLVVEIGFGGEEIGLSERTIYIYFY